MSDIIWRSCTGIWDYDKQVGCLYSRMGQETVRLKKAAALSDQMINAVAYFTGYADLILLAPVMKSNETS